MDLLSALITGFLTSFALIAAIGAQNAFVLAQGLTRRYNGLIAVTCASTDAILIVAGIAGMGILIAASPTLMWLTALAGALFLTAYGAKALKSAFSSHRLLPENRSLKSWQSALATTLTISLLNPHVYLDTVVLIGSIGGQYAGPAKWWFAIGASMASLVWFLCLSFGAARLAPLFARPSSWRVLDGAVCLMMWGIALSLWRIVWQGSAV